MSLNIEEVRRIAHLARLRLSAEEERTFAPQLAEIVAYIDQLEEFETAPTVRESSSLPEAEDEPGDCLERDRLLDNAPEALDSFFVVPQVKATENE